MAETLASPSRDTLMVCYNDQRIGGSFMHGIVRSEVFDNIANLLPSTNMEQLGDLFEKNRRRVQVVLFFSLENHPENGAFDRCEVSAVAHSLAETVPYVLSVYIDNNLTSRDSNLVEISSDGQELAPEIISAVRKEAVKAFWNMQRNETVDTHRHGFNLREMEALAKEIGFGRNIKNVIDDLKNANINTHNLLLELIKLVYKNTRNGVFKISDADDGVPSSKVRCPKRLGVATINFLSQYLVTMDVMAAEDVKEVVRVVNKLDIDSHEWSKVIDPDKLSETEGVIDSDMRVFSAIKIYAKQEHNRERPQNQDALELWQHLTAVFDEDEDEVDDETTQITIKKKSYTLEGFTALEFHLLESYLRREGILVDEER